MGAHTSCIHNIHRIYFGYMKILMAIKIDVAVKRRAQKVVADLGLTLSAVVNAMLKQLIRDRELNLVYGAKNDALFESILAEVQQDLKTGKIFLRS